MGKIYEALKKAEREAMLRKKQGNLQVLPLQTELENAEKQPVLTTKKTADERDRTFFKAIERSQPFQGEGEKRLPGDGTDALFTLHDPHSLVAEQFKMLRTRLLRFAQSRPLKTVLITSTVPDEGKSTVAANLAVCIAHGFNERVILVDTDLRKPSIDHLFGLSSGQGLVDYLSNRHTLSDVLQPSGIDKLSIIPSGAIPKNPSMLIASEKMKQLLLDIKSQYQDCMIIFDSSPVLQTSEPRILGDVVDGIILVVRSGRANRELISDTVNTLGKEKILGIVFNQSGEQIKSYYNYSYYNPSALQANNKA